MSSHKPKRNRAVKVPVNPVLDVNILRCASVYAEANLSENDKQIAYRILELVAQNDHVTARHLMEDFARPEFRSVLDYFRVKQFVALLSKVPFKEGRQAAARKARALSGFEKSELRCRIANKRLRYYRAHPNRLPDTMRVILSRIKGEVRRILGPLNEGVLEHILELARPGGGVAIGTWNRFRVSLPFKIGATDLSCTSSARPYAIRLLNKCVHWGLYSSESIWKVENGKISIGRKYPIVTEENNRISFVPKDARTLRAIAIEPALNMWLQLGVHNYLSGRLERLGNGIGYQSRNQLMARKGSETWEDPNRSLSTVDLSSASDSISLALCELLLPADWLALLCDLRCEAGVVGGSTILYEKLSSMGNGYTFVIETVLFWAIARVCADYCGGGCVSAYGDDIIVPTRSSALLIEVLAFCGFKVNTEKSFILGPFRESCGADWHSGHLVTPQYLRRAVLRPTDVYNLLNCASQKLAWADVRSYLLTEVRRKVGVLYGLENEDPTTCLFVDVLDARRRGVLKWDVDTQSWLFKGIKFIPESPRTPSDWAYLAALAGGDGEHYSLRGRGLFLHRELSRGFVLRG